MVEVLEPLEEGNCHTTSIDVQVRNDQDVAVDQDLVGCGGRWPVGSFRDDLNKGNGIALLWKYMWQ